MKDDKTVPADSGSKKPTLPKKPRPQYWLLYIAMVLSGLLFLGEAANIAALRGVPAKLAVALLFSAFALLVGKGRPMGYIATGLVWVTVITLFVV